MLSGIIKYSDERNRRFSIITTIVNNSMESYVEKESVFPEGNKHIQSMYENQKKLVNCYTNVKICKGTMTEGNKIRFDFVFGESLEKKYVNAVINQDIKEFERLLLKHKEIIVGLEDNKCEFYESQQFEEIFGDGKAYTGRQGLKFSNFDAIPSNIIFDKGEPTFIDYEWIMDFAMPLELVLYNCIDNLYLKNKCVEAFYSKEKALRFLNVQIELDILKKSYANFFQYIITDKDGRSYANDKISCLKPLDTIEGIRKEWENCASEWRNSSLILVEKEKELAEARREWAKCADEWKNTVGVLEKKEDELKEVRQEWQKCADEWRETVSVVKERDIELVGARKEWEFCANEWKKTVKALEEKEKELAVARQEWQNCAEEWKKTVSVVEERDIELAEARKEWEFCANEWKKTVEILEEREKELAAVKSEHEAIINSKAWRTLTRLKNPLNKE